MGNRHRFRPIVAELLEGRQLMSRGARGSSVVFAPSNLPVKRADIVFVANDQINQSFDSFTNDYLKAQGTYFASGSDQGVVASRFFRSYIVNRLDLLSQQLTRTFATLPGALEQRRATPARRTTVLEVFLDQNINGGTRGNLRDQLAGPNDRRSPIPASTTSGPVATLYTDQALSAIESARAETLNSSDFLILHGTDKGHHKK